MPRTGDVYNTEGYMDLLSRKEELILLAIWKLGDDACGISIMDELEASTGVKWMFGSIYTPLGKLYDKGLIRKSTRHSAHEKGGRPKVLFTLTQDGIKELEKIREFNASLWSDVPPISI